MEISEKHAPNDEYENFVTSQTGAAIECIPTKPRAEYWVPWESLIIWKKWDNMKIACVLDKRNSENANGRWDNKVIHSTKKKKNAFKARSITSETR